MKHYELVIVGLGAMGSAALYQAARRKVNVLGIDRYSPPHRMGSSHAESRITRLAVGEGAQYAPLVRRSHEIWRELEQRTGNRLLYQPGGYVIAPRSGSTGFHGNKSDFVHETYTTGKTNGVPVSYHSAAEIAIRHPQLLVAEEEHGVFESTAGVVLCEQAISDQLQLAATSGAAIHLNEQVRDIFPVGSHVEIRSDRKHYLAEKVIVTAGPWMQKFCPPELGDKLRIFRQVVYWFAARDLTQFDAEHFPFTIRIGREAADFFASFPWVRGGVAGIKMLTEQYQLAADHPEKVNRRVSNAEIQRFYRRHVRRHLRSVEPRCIRAEVCLYTLTPDQHFLIDHHPGSDRLLLASPCSGHGFKHSAAIGESLVQMAIDGRSAINLESFKMR